MNSYMQELLTSFADGTPLDNEQYETLINEGFVTFNTKVTHTEFKLTVAGVQALKTLIWHYSLSKL